MRRAVAALGAVACLALPGCIASGARDQGFASHGAVATVRVADVADAPFRPVTITVRQDTVARALLPAAIRRSGQLRIGVGALAKPSPPLVLTGSDQHTLTGAEPDVARLVAAALGLRPVVYNSTWENLLLGIRGDRVDVGFSNITVTEERKQTFDFATYRDDNLALEVPARSRLRFTGDYRVLAGLAVAVSSGTNQEALLLDWQRRLRAAGKDLTLQYFPDQNSVNLALAAGRIDAYFGPNPNVQYHIAQDSHGPHPTRTAGTYSGAGPTLQGLIAATSLKGNGVAQAVRAAVDHLIATGAYGQWLAAYHLTNEGVPRSLVNPPGLPMSSA